MKKLIILVIPALVFMLAGCSSIESEDKKQEKKSTQKQDKTSTEQMEQKQETNEQTSEQEKNTDSLNHAKPIEEMTPEEYDTYLLTQKRSYLTEEQQERYDELLEMKGSSPAENDEKNQTYNRKMKNKIEGNGGGTALIEPRREGETNEEHKKRQEKLVEQAKQKEAESTNNKQPQQAQQSQQVQQQQKQKTQQQPTQEIQRKEQSSVDNSEKEVVVKEAVNNHEKHVTEE